MNTLETMVDKLKDLPEEKLSEVADFIDTLSRTPTSGPFGNLAGSLASTEVARMRYAPAGS